jgi:CheY-like chemotaxis protein
MKTGNFDAILMDLQMPEMDGYTATRLIRNELKSDIPIIAMTADALVGEDTRCIESGMNGYISKPFESNALYAKVLEFTRKKTFTRQDNSDRATAADLVDLSYVHDLYPNDKVRSARVINIFLDTMPEGLAQLAHLVRDTEDYEAIYRQAHFLKSSVSVIRVRDMFANLTKLEDLAKAHAPREQMLPLLEVLETTFDAARPVLLAEKEGGVQKL